MSQKQSSSVSSWSLLILTPLLSLSFDLADSRPTSPMSWQSIWPWLGLGQHYGPHSGNDPNKQHGETDASEVSEDAFTFASCSLCDVALNIIKASLEYGIPREVVQQSLEVACTVSGELTSGQCFLVMEKYAEEISYVMRNKDETISFGEICALLIGLPCTILKGNEISWEVKAPGFVNLHTSNTTNEGDLEYSDEDELFDPYLKGNFDDNGADEEQNALRGELGIQEGDNLVTTHNHRQPRLKVDDLRDSYVRGTEGLRDDGIFHRRSPVKPETRKRTFKILHIADIHHDPMYAEGSNANCGSYLCCHSKGPATKNEDRAGRWGDYRNCDSPSILVEFMLDHMRKAHKDVEMVYWTGDVNPHDPWDLDNYKAAWNLNYTLYQIRSRFGHLPIFSAVGNHETDPTNLFPSPQLAAFKPTFDSTKWLYEALKKEWPTMTLSNYKDLKKSFETIEKAGFYSASPMPGFRVISVNTIFCYTYNLYNFLPQADPAEQLDWLNAELLAAEKLSEKVHIVGHVPPGYPDCLPSWSHSFRNIVARFNETITGMFYGHTHLDDIQVFRHKDTGTPYEVAYVGPSLTPYSFLNPAYRVYEIDYDTMEVVDYATHYLNLTEANESGFPKIRKLYSAKSAYGLANLSAGEWKRWIDRIIRSDEEFQLHYRNLHRNSPVYPPCKTIRCKRDRICTMVTADMSDQFRCIMGLVSILNHHGRNSTVAISGGSYYQNGLPKTHQLNLAHHHDTS